MNNVQLQRTLRLLRRTGDRGIVLDAESDEVFILMDADAYEKMLPSEVLPKKDGDDHLDDYVLDDLLEIEEISRPSEEVVEKKPVKVEQEKNHSVATSKKLKFTEDWVAEKNPILSEESLADVPHEEEEEEKFYLEPVE